MYGGIENSILAGLRVPRGQVVRFGSQRCELAAQENLPLATMPQTCIPLLIQARQTIVNGEECSAPKESDCQLTSS